MKHTRLACFWGALLLIEPTMAYRHALSSSDESTEQNPAPSGDSTEESERLVFLLQYLATDYERAVQNGHIADSLEYNEMQRFAGYAAKIYQATAAMQQKTLDKLRQIEELIANRAALPQIRKICDETIAILIKEKNLPVAPRRTPALDYGKSLYEENCIPCHGLLGAGDGPSADTLNPRPRDFTDPERMNLCTPLQFYHAITFGVEGTAMPSFSEALAPRPRWNLAFYLMTLRRDFQPAAPAAPQKITLQDLATKNNLELAAMILSQQHSPHADSSPDPKHLVDYYRQNPPEQTTADHASITEEGLKQSLAAFQRGDFAGADRFAQEAYWDGFEFMEGLLPWQIYLAFERDHAEYLLCIEEKGAPKKAQALVKKMLKMMEQIRKQKGLRHAP